MEQYAYEVSSSARENLVPNLRLAASNPWMGLTAFIGDEPHLIIGKQGENTFIMEDQFGQVRKVDFIFPWEEPRVESNKLVAASRIEESPFREAGYLAYDDETGEWAVRIGRSTERFPLEESIAALEEAGWSKFAEGLGGLDLGGGGKSGPNHHLESPGEHSEHEHPTVEVRAACPHCGSDQHLELLGDEDDEHSGKERSYACHNCGKWCFEHELKVSDHDKGDQDQNPEDVDYSEHDDDASRHQEPEEEKEVHNEKEHNEDHEEKFPKKRSYTSEPFSFQGYPAVKVRGTRRGEALKPEEQSDEDMINHVHNLPQPHQQEQEYVRNRYQDLGLGSKPYSYDNPFINRGGSVREADYPSVPKTQPTYPEEFSGGTYILVAKWLRPDHTVMFSSANGKGVDPRFKGIITMLGGPGSHAVVVAGGNSMPCIIASGEDIDRIRPGDQVVLDGETGVVHVNGGDPNFVAQDPNTLTADTPIYRFVYANGHGLVEKMVPGQMVGELGGHGGMLAQLMGEGHVQMSDDFLSHNASLGFICEDGTVLQDVNEIPDQQVFEQWIHGKEAELGLQPGPIKRLDISAYLPGEGMAGGGSAPAQEEGIPAGVASVKTAATFEMPYPGGMGIHNGTSASFAHAGLHATVTAPGLPQPITLPFSAPNMFIMIKMFQAQGLLKEGQPIQVDTENPELAQQLILQQSGTTAKVAYEEKTTQPTHDKLDEALKCPHCQSHTIECLSTDEDSGNAEWLCLTCDNTFRGKYRKTAGIKHQKGTRVEIVHPSKKGIKGSIADHAGTDPNFGDELYDLLLDNGDEMKKVPDVHFKKIKSAAVTADYTNPQAQTPEQQAQVQAILAQLQQARQRGDQQEVQDLQQQLENLLSGGQSAVQNPNPAQPTQAQPTTYSHIIVEDEEGNVVHSAVIEKENFVKSAALTVGEWYTMYSPNYKVPDVIQVTEVNESGITAKIEGDDKGLFPIDLPHAEIEKEGYKFEPYATQPKTAKVARREFTVKEQQDLINENLEGRARNYHKLNLEGTHYKADIEASVNPLTEDIWWW